MLIFLKNIKKALGCFLLVLFITHTNNSISTERESKIKSTIKNNISSLIQDLPVKPETRIRLKEDIKEAQLKFTNKSFDTFYKKGLVPFIAKYTQIKEEQYDFALVKFALKALYKAIHPDKYTEEEMKEYLREIVKILNEWSSNLTENNQSTQGDDKNIPNKNKKKTYTNVKGENVNFFTIRIEEPCIVGNEIDIETFTIPNETLNSLKEISNFFSTYSEYKKQNLNLRSSSPHSKNEISPNLKDKISLISRLITIKLNKYEDFYKKFASVYEILANQYINQTTDMRIKFFKQLIADQYTHYSEMGILAILKFLELKDKNLNAFLQEEINRICKVMLKDPIFKKEYLNATLQEEEGKISFSVISVLKPDLLNALKKEIPSLNGYKTFNDIFENIKGIDPKKNLTIQLRALKLKSTNSNKTVALNSSKKLSILQDTKTEVIESKNSDDNKLKDTKTEVIESKNSDENKPKSEGANNSWIARVKSFITNNSKAIGTGIALISAAGLAAYYKFYHHNNKKKIR